MRITQYITDTKTTLVRFRILLSMEEVHKSQYEQTMALMPSLLENIEEAKAIIRGFLNSRLQSDQKNAKDFIEYIRTNRLLANHDPSLQLLEFYMEWQVFYEVLPEELIEPCPIVPRSEGIMDDTVTDKEETNIKPSKQVADTVFTDLLVCSTDKKEHIITLIKDHLKEEKPRDIYHALSALHKLGYLPILGMQRKRAEIYRAYIIEFKYSKGYNALKSGLNYYFQDGATDKILTQEYEDLFE